MLLWDLNWQKNRNAGNFFYISNSRIRFRYTYHRRIVNKIIFVITFNIPISFDNLSFSKLALLDKDLKSTIYNCKIAILIVWDILYNRRAEINLYKFNDRNVQRADYNIEILALYNTNILTAITPGPLKIYIDDMTAITPVTKKFLNA